MKFKSFLTAHKTLIKDVVTSTCLVGASAGIVFGVSAGCFAINYMDLASAEARLAASKTSSYYSENISSMWNMNGGKDADGNEIPAYEDKPQKQDISSKTGGEGLTWWKKLHGQDATPWDTQHDSMGMDKAFGGEQELTDSEIKARYAYNSMIIDGATHTTMDRSFNQSLYQGLVDFNHNKLCDHCDSETGTDPVNMYIANSMKPSQDNTTDFINTYAAAIKEHTVIGLAGFNHSTPLNAMMTHKVTSGGKCESVVSNADEALNKELNQTAFILIDANCPNNQNVASVQFRADQPGFLTALATCSYFYNNIEMYHDKFQDMSVGLYGGVAIPTVTIYMGGFQRGIEFFNQKVLVEKIILMGSTEYYAKQTDGRYYDIFASLVEHSKYKDELNSITSQNDFIDNYAQKFYDEYSVKIIKLGDLSTHFSGTFIAGDAIGITKQYLNRGASAIVAVAGPQSLDSAQEIQNQNSKCIVIGVDTAMEDGDYQRYHKGCGPETKTTQNKDDPYMDKTVALDGSVSQQSNSIIKFSAVKDIRTVTTKITQLCAEGKNWDVTGLDQNSEIEKPDPKKAICAPGFQTCGNIENGLISISWDGFYPLIQVLDRLDYYVGADGQAMDFKDVWCVEALKYFEELDERGIDVDEDYRAAMLLGPDPLYTFKRTDDEGKPTIYFQNYNHTIAILGKVLSEARLDFGRSLTLALSGNPEAPYRMLEEDEVLNIPILEWLDLNMYLLS